MRAIATVIYLVLATAAAAVAFGGSGGGSAARPVATAVDGEFHYEDSRDGMPIFEAEDVGPGDSVSGSVEITNTGEAPGGLTLIQRDVLDTPGTGTGLLSRRMSIRIRDVTSPGGSATVYEGPLAPMPALALGALGPGRSRTFQFDAVLPDGGAPASSVGGDNSVQGASVSIGYTWLAGGAEEVAESPAGTPSASSPGQPQSAAPDRPSLRLRILRIQPFIRHRRLVLRAHCSTSCLVVAHLRFRARGARLSRARLPRSLVGPRRVSGSQKLAFRLPGHLFRTLRKIISGGRRATVRVVLRARSPEGERAVAHGRTRLRHLYPLIRRAGPGPASPSRPDPPRSP